MKRPDSFYAVTVKEYREKYNENRRCLSNYYNMVLAGFEIPAEVENVTNSVLSMMIEQNDYIREAEKRNYGWDKNLVDFSLTSPCGR